MHKPTPEGSATHWLPDSHSGEHVGQLLAKASPFGGSFKNADLKLVAGDINRANINNNGIPMYERTQTYSKSLGAEADLVEEKKFFEYHIYEVANKTDLLNNENKQIIKWEISKI